MKITIIMALYNVEDCMDRAISSVLAQTIGQEHLQVILVDDHSTDGTWEKAKTYAEDHGNFHLLQTAKNSGSCGTPRNIALEQVETPYVMFLDPDDRYEANACEVLLDKMEGMGVDLVQGSSIINGTVSRTTPRERVVQGLLNLLQLPLKNSCSQLYRMELIRAGRVRFTDGIIYEDNEFYYGYLLQSPRVLLTPVVIHHYDTRESGPTLSATRKTGFRPLDDLATAYGKVHVLLDTEDPSYIHFLKDHLMEEFIWKVSVTGELTMEEERLLSQKIAWLNDIWIRKDHKDEIIHGLIRSGQINLLGNFFRYVLEEGNLMGQLKKKIRKILGR